MNIDFTARLLKWNKHDNQREMPWKGEKNAYRIWLSEIILQQTRVEQGLDYYNRFISGFPTIDDLAGAREQEVFKYWEGLGYYSRCRNLIATAKKISKDYNGQFPETYEEIIALPGIGPYTAAAISSFAFGLPYAVVDGNVERVLARYFGLNIPAGAAAVKKLYTLVAQTLLDKKDPGNFNQAMMDFGATVCKPQNPLCGQCVQKNNCEAFKNGWTTRLPVKTVSQGKKERWLYYFVVDAGADQIWIRERKEKDIWQNLYEFILLETGKIIPQDQLFKSPLFLKQFGQQRLSIKYISPPYRQTLTHQSINGCFVHLSNELPSMSGYTKVQRTQLAEYPFPKLIADHIRQFPGLQVHGKDFDVDTGNKNCGDRQQNQD